MSVRVWASRASTAVGVCGGAGGCVADRIGPGQSTDTPVRSAAMPTGGPGSEYFVARPCWAGDSPGAGRTAHPISAARWWFPLLVVLIALSGCWGLLKADQVVAEKLIWPTAGAQFVEVGPVRTIRRQPAADDDRGRRAEPEERHRRRRRP